MDNRIIGLIVIVLIVIIGAVYILASPGNQNQTVNANTTNITVVDHANTTSVNNATSSKNSTGTNSTANIKISAKQAQQIAIDAEKDLTGKTVTAGTPTLIKWTANNKHTWIWEVPLFDTNGKNAGSMDVDAYTGEVIMNE